MNEKEKKQKFLQLQFCMLLLALTLLPEFSLTSLLGLPSFDIPVFCCQLAGLIGGGLALFRFYQSVQAASMPLPMPFLASAAGGMLVALVTMFPGIPSWLEYIGLIALLIALYLAKDSVGIQWKCWGSQGAYLILLAVLLHVYDGIGDTLLTGLAALVGLIFYFIGKPEFTTNYLKPFGTIFVNLLKFIVDNGIQGVSKLKIAVILGIVAVIIGMLPLIGGIIGGIIAIVAFVFEFIGYGALQKSVTVGHEGQAGAGKLRISMIIVLVGVILGFFPGIGGTLQAFLSLVALWLVFLGWNKILFGLEGEVEKTVLT